MSVLVVGTTALDSIKTPKAENPRLLGGSAAHAAVAASFFAPANLVGIVGKDFPKRYLNLFDKHGINMDGLEIADGETFHWSGEYEENMNRRQTLHTVLGVIEHYDPVLAPSIQKLPYVLLANISPQIQHRVLDQIKKPKFVVADTMDLWINIAMEELTTLLKRIDMLVLNDSEAPQLTDTDNLFTAIKKIHKMGPKYVIVKKGEHGAILSGPKGLFITSAFPLEKVVDPTGAGDSFVGGMVGYLASQKGPIDKHLKKAIVAGSVTASFCCEGFGLKRTTKTTREEIDARIASFEKLVQF